MSCLLRLFPLIILSLVPACAAEVSDEPTGTPQPDAPAAADHAMAIDQLIAGLAPLSSEPPRRIAGTPGAPVADGDYQCVDTPIDEVRQHDQLLGQLTIGDVLWPGALLRGDSVHAGQLTPITLPRAPITFSVSLESLGAGERSATLPQPSLSTYRDAIADILAQNVEGSTAARISAEVEEISSEQQLAIALGAEVSAPLVGSVKGGFNFSDTSKRSRYMVKYFQLYYTVDVDPPNLPHDFFAPSVTAEDVGAVVSPSSPPVYVSSIGYGRQVIFTFESELSKSELEAALSFVYQGGAEISGSTSLTHQEVLSHTHTTAFILGGDAGEAASVAIGSYEQLREFIGRGGNYSKDSPGAAIAYKLAYVRDHQPTRVSYASTYSERACSRVTQKLRVVFQNIKVDDAGSDLGGDLEVFGSVSIASDREQKTLASWPVAQYKRIAQGATYPQSGVLGEAILSVTPQPGQWVRVSTSLSEDDGTFNDSFGVDVRDVAPFESGWRRTLDVHRTSGSQQITLRVSLVPIP